METLLEFLIWAARSLVVLFIFFWVYKTLKNEQLDVGTTPSQIVVRKQDGTFFSSSGSSGIVFRLVQQYGST